MEEEYNKKVTRRRYSKSLGQPFRTEINTNDVAGVVTG
jgi:hypothetical protein